MLNKTEYASTVLRSNVGLFRCLSESDVDNKLAMSNTAFTGLANVGRGLGSYLSFVAAVMPLRIDIFQGWRDLPFAVIPTRNLNHVVTRTYRSIAIDGRTQVRHKKAPELVTPLPP